MKAQTKLFLKAVDIFGSKSALARALGVSPQAVWAVIKADKGNVSLKMANGVHEITNGGIPREGLNCELKECAARPKIPPQKIRSVYVKYGLEKEDRTWPHDKKLLVRAVKKSGGVKGVAEAAGISRVRIYQLLHSETCKLRDYQKEAIKNILKK